jgi:hypothetical protein
LTSATPGANSTSTACWLEVMVPARIVELGVGSTSRVPGLVKTY